LSKQTDADGRVSKVSKLNFSTWAKEPWIEALGQATPRLTHSLKPLFEYLEFCLQQIVADNELGALQALEGEYVIPGPGGDPIRNPMFCPRARISTPSTPIDSLQQLLYFQPKLWWIGS